MDKQNVIITQKLWKNYPNTEYWIDIISHPEKHMIIYENKVIGVDSDYKKAQESLKYILTTGLAKSPLL